ncbi:MAG: DUF1820 family protein [Mariprofundus sp.]
MAKKHIYKITFLNQGNVYEIYARHVGQSGMLGFVEVSDLTFGERSSVVLDPSEDKLKSEFRSVKRTYIPLHSIIRIDEVEKEGTAKITKVSDTDSKVTPFPMPMFNPGGDAGKS